MSASEPNPVFKRVYSPYIIAVIAVCFALISTLQLGSALKHSSTIFFYCVMLSSWYGGLWPGLLAAALSWVTLDYYFIPPIYSFAMNLEEVPGIVVFGAAACFISWLNSGQRRVRKSFQQGPETESGLAAIVVKFICAIVASVAACLVALVTTTPRSGGSLEHLLLTIGFASCCSAFFLVILASRNLL